MAHGVPPSRLRTLTGGHLGKGPRRPAKVHPGRTLEAAIQEIDEGKVRQAEYDAAYAIIDAEEAAQLEHAQTAQYSARPERWRADNRLLRPLRPKWSELWRRYQRWLPPAHVPIEVDAFSAQGILQSSSYRTDDNIIDIINSQLHVASSDTLALLLARLC